MPSTIHQLDVFHNPIRAGRTDKPFLVSVQHHRFDHLSSRVMAPLVRKNPIGNEVPWFPALSLENEGVFYFDPTDLSTIPVRMLGARIANLDSERYRILRAIDLVLTGV